MYPYNTPLRFSDVSYPSHPPQPEENKERKRLPRRTISRAPFTVDIPEDQRRKRLPRRTVSSATPFIVDIPEDQRRKRLPRRTISRAVDYGTLATRLQNLAPLTRSGQQRRSVRELPPNTTPLGDTRPRPGHLVRSRKTNFGPRSRKGSVRRSIEIHVPPCDSIPTQQDTTDQYPQPVMCDDPAYAALVTQAQPTVYDRINAEYDIVPNKDIYRCERCGHTGNATNVAKHHWCTTAHDEYLLTKSNGYGKLCLKHNDELPSGGRFYKIA